MVAELWSFERSFEKENINAGRKQVKLRGSAPPAPHIAVSLWLTGTMPKSESAPPALLDWGLFYGYVRRQRREGWIVRLSVSQRLTAMCGGKATTEVLLKFWRRRVGIEPT
jgi:hypothetical protein